MLVMRNCFGLALAAGFLAIMAVPAEAASPCRGHKPAWWNAPRVTYIHNGHQVRNIAAQGTSSRAVSRTYSAAPARYAQSRGYSHRR